MTSSPVVLVCPCCASTVDAVSASHEQEFWCATCDQTWSMVVDADRHATYSLS